MMNDGKEWQAALPEFLLEAEMLLAKSEECLSHLHLIRNDNDAIDCMKNSLTKLAEKADAMALEVRLFFMQSMASLSLRIKCRWLKHSSDLASSISASRRNSGSASCHSLPSFIMKVSTTYGQIVRCSTGVIAAN